MSVLEIIKTKIKLPRVYIPLGIVVVVIFFSFRSYQAKNQPPEYETTIVARGTLTQTVEATGKLESKDDVSLRFEIPGTLMTVNVIAGANVKAGRVLASLRLSELNASVAQAAANLQQKRAGASDQDREYYRAAVDAAKATLEQTKIDVQASINAAGAAANTAYNNLKRADGGDNSLIITEAYEDAVGVLQSSLVKLDDGLVQADNILGIDNISANDSFESSLSTANPEKKYQAEIAYYGAKQAIISSRAQIITLSSASLHNQIDLAFPATEVALLNISKLLSAVSQLLDATQPSGNLTQSLLDTKKTTIITTRSAITAQYTTTISERHSIETAKNSYTTYSIASQKAQQDLADAKAKSDSTIQIKQAAYDQAIANYNGKILPTRWVDLAPYQAALSAAVASREKAILRAPIDGIVAKINKKKGELVTSADVMIQMVSPHFEIKVDVPETDITKMVSSTRREAEFTLDAFGEETKFKGTVININKQSTEIQDVVYYQVTITVSDDHVNKPIQAGMTANVKIITDLHENALSVPQRAVRTRDNGEKYVRILDTQKKEQEKTITLGLRADGGKVEIVDGLQAGETVIIATKKK